MRQEFDAAVRAARPDVGNPAAHRAAFRMMVDMHPHNDYAPVPTGHVYTEHEGSQPIDVTEVSSRMLAEPHGNKERIIRLRTTQRLLVEYFEARYLAAMRTGFDLGVRAAKDAMSAGEKLRTALVGS